MSEKDLQNVEEGRSKFSSYVLTQAILVTVACSLILIFARDRPPTFPSKAASKKQEPLNFKKEFAALMANKNYMILCLAFTCQYANSSALGAIISSITFSYGYMSSDNAIFGGSFIICGILGSFFVAVLLDKIQKFKATLQILTALSLISFLIAFLTLPWGNTLLFALTIMLIGGSMVPIVPTSFAFSVELTYPTSESISNGMMILPSKVYGVILGVVASYLCRSSPLYAIGLMALNAFISFIAIFYLHEEFRRLKYSLEAASLK